MNFRLALTPLHRLPRSLPVISARTFYYHSLEKSRSALQQHQNVRHLGIIGDAISGFASKKVEGSKEKAFKQMVDLMLGTEKWTLKQWKATMEEHLNSWMMYIPGVSSSNESKELKGIKTMLDSMTPAELDNPSLINGLAKERIAKAAEKPVDEVSRVLSFYNQSVVLQQWLRLKKEKGEVLPASDVEMQRMAQEDPRIKLITQKVLFPDKRRSGRGKRMF